MTECGATWQNTHGHRCERKSGHKGDHKCWACEERRPRDVLTHGRWSNGDPVHIIFDGLDRWIAPNHNGADWLPGNDGINPEAGEPS